jgi:hypothetical protein
MDVFFEKPLVVELAFWRWGGWEAGGLVGWCEGGVRDRVIDCMGANVVYRRGCLFIE